MNRTFNVAVVGATGLVGETMIEMLEKRDFPVENFYPLAGDNSAGKTIFFNDHSHKVGLVGEFDFSQVDLALFTAGSDVTAEYAGVAADAGAVVIDNSGFFVNDGDVPMVIPEVNPDALIDYSLRNIVASPDSCTIQMLVALSPIYRQLGLRKINVSTYQAVSGSGRKAVEEIAGQTAALLNAREPVMDVYSKQIAFNLIPQVGRFEDNGYTLAEMRLIWETRKILGDDQIQVNPTCVRVPVFFGHSATLHVEACSPISAYEVRDMLLDAPGVEVLDEQIDGGCPTPVTDATGSDLVYVSRIRDDLDNENGIDLFVMADNVRKGAALNSVQIAEILIAQYM